MVEDAAPVEERGESIPEPKSTLLLTEAEMLERGHPGEFLPGPQLDRMMSMAEAYVRDQSSPPDGRQRVREVWLQGRYQPAYQRHTPRKPVEASADDFG